MATYQDYQKMLQDYYAAQGPAPQEPYYDPQAEVSGGGQAAGYADALKAYQNYTTKTGQGWLDSLSPAQLAEYNAYHQQAVDANAKKARNGAIIALAAPLAAAGAGAALGGSLGVGGGSSTLGAWSGGWDALPTFAGGGSATGGGLLGSLGSAGSALAKGGLGNLGGKIGAIAGGLLGATQKSPTDTMTKTIDPRMANYLYGADGNGGILGGAYDLYKRQMATGGLNAVQNEGLNKQLAVLRSPQYTQGYDAMRNSGLGLLNSPVAGNPYVKG